MTEYGITASQTVGPFLKIGLVREGQEFVVPKNTNGALKIQVNQQYSLADTQRAHEDLESRLTTGSTVLIP